MSYPTLILKIIATMILINPCVSCLLSHAKLLSNNCLIFSCLLVYCFGIGGFCPGGGYYSWGGYCPVNQNSSTYQWKNGVAYTSCTAAFLNQSGRDFFHSAFSKVTESQHQLIHDCCVWSDGLSRRLESMRGID